MSLLVVFKQGSCTGDLFGHHLLPNINLCVLGFGAEKTLTLMIACLWVYEADINALSEDRVETLEAAEF